MNYLHTGPNMCVERLLEGNSVQCSAFVAIIRIQGIRALSISRVCGGKGKKNLHRPASPSKP